MTQAPDRAALLALYDETMRRNASVAGCAREQSAHVVRYTTATGSQRYIMWHDFADGFAETVVDEEVNDVRGKARVLMWKLYAHDTARAALRAALLARGFAENDHSTLMACSVEAALAALTANDDARSDQVGLDVRELSTPQSLDAYQEIWDDVWPDAPNARYVDDYRDRLLKRDPGIVFFAGFAANDEPVSSGYMFHAPGAPYALLCGGTTKAAWRRQRAYTSLLRARAIRAQVRGASHLAVEASAESRPILERLGFMPLSTLAFYEKHIDHDAALVQTFVIDSISAITAEMRGQIVVTGSHGGVSAAHLALAHPPGLAVFNDAGMGLDRAGVRGLELLDRQGVAACAVSHETARIGEAASTLESGRISDANRTALQCGIAAGQTCAEAISFFRKSSLVKG